MRSNRRKNWFIKRIALGLAIAAVAAPVAQAKMGRRIVRPGERLSGFRADFPSYPHGGFVNASDYGMPRPTATDYAISRGDLIEVVRSTPNGTPSDKIEFVRTQPRSIGEPTGRLRRLRLEDAGPSAQASLSHSSSSAPERRSPAAT